VEQNIGEFLRSRRARIQPQDVGLVGYGRRRVPGLRREELAALAGVSVDYYVRLEQGRSPSVSDSVLDSIGRALHLDGAEQAHLRDLVRPVDSTRRATTTQRVRPAVQRLLDMMTGVPAFVLGRRLDILAWNDLADAVYGYSRQEPAFRNAGRHLFLNPAAHDFYPDWETVAAETVGVLRRDAGRYPDDPLTAALVGELSMKSEPFRELWARHDVRDKIHGHKLINHPVVGELKFDYESLAPPGDTDQLVITYTVEVNSPTDERLRLLASWQASEIPTEADPATEANQR